MSWDVHIVRAAFEGESPEQILEDEAANAVPLGSAEEVRRALAEAAPGVDFSADPAYGILRRDDWSFEFNLGPDDPAPSLMVHIRSRDESFLPVLRAVCERLQARAYDTSLARFIDFSHDPCAGFREWRDGVAHATEFYRKGSLNGRRPREILLRVPSLCRPPLQIISDTMKRLFRKETGTK